VSRRPFVVLDANVAWFDVVDSTNAVAERLLAGWSAGGDVEPGETIVIADEQKAGRGRGRNRWHSPLGGAYLTWLASLATEGLAVAPLAAGLALAETVEALLPGTSLGLKWPNDLFVRGSKLGGVLCQSRAGPARSWLAVGVGVNVRAVAGPHEAFSSPATALSDLGFTGSAQDAAAALAAGLVPRLRAALATPEGVVAGWAARTIHRPGDVLRVRTADGAVAGTFLGFTADGRLRLEVAGATRTIAAGDLNLPLGDGGG
jgi:BirA family transcriptional regulator, biotin operon repressor / biotin---[acetyl-CoA-carboxylase] ligase